MRYIRFFFLVSALVTAGDPSMAQTLTPGEWQTYTSMRTATDVALTSDSLHAWVSTGGGAFEIDIRFPRTLTRALRTTNGLSENNLTAVAADGMGRVYFGGADGSFNLYTAASGTVRKLGTEIQNASYTNKSINSITVAGSRVYLATGYGVTVYNASDSAFGPTATEIAGLPTQDSVRQVLDDGATVYGAMEEGVAVAPSNLDLHAGSNWKLLRGAGGAVRSLAVYHGTIYAGAESGLYMVSLPQDTLLPIPGAPSFINRLCVAHDSLCILDESGAVYTTDDLNSFEKQSFAMGSTAVAFAPDTLGGFVLASNANGLALPLDDSLLTNLFPNGPIINAIQGLSFSTYTDRLYVTQLLAGFASFRPSDDSWTDFQSGTGSVPLAKYLNILYDSVRNSLWLTSLGNPLYRVQNLDSGTPVWSSFNSSEISAYSGDYMRTAGLMIDRDSNLVVTSWSGDGKGLSITSDGIHFQRYSLQPNGASSWNPVTQDLDGNYWVGTENPFGSPTAAVGVYWLRASDGQAGDIPGGSGETLGNSAGSQFVSAMLTDQDGAIWCGTYAGVEIISNPYAIEAPNPIFSVRNVPFLGNQVVHAMAVDGVGNKWIGTDNGIFVVSPDGADSIARYTKENSPLIDNVVNALAIDPGRGEVYVGTPSGISRFSTIFKQGRPSYSSVRVFPDPVTQLSDGTLLDPNGTVTPYIYVDGLVAGSTVQIFSLGGRLINTINGTALGSTVTWTGRDALGRDVPSGMYLISGTSAQTGENGQAKVVIIRKP